MSNPHTAALEEIDKVAGEVQTVLITQMQKKVEVKERERKKTRKFISKIHDDRGLWNNNLAKLNNR